MHLLLSTCDKVSCNVLPFPKYSNYYYSNNFPSMPYTLKAVVTSAALRTLQSQAYKATSEVTPKSFRYDAVTALTFDQEGSW